MTMTQLLVRETEMGVIRCLSCGRLLAKGALLAGELEIVCNRCKATNRLRAMSPNPEPLDGRSRPQGEIHAPSHSRR